MSNRHFFEQRAKAIQALLNKPCEWNGCGQPSSYVAIKNKLQLQPLCDLHAFRAERFGYEIHAIPAQKYDPVFPHPDDQR